MHWLLAEVAQEPECHQVQIAVHETVPAHELGSTKLSCLMVNRFFANICEACILGKVWNVAMHLTVYFDVLHYVAAVSLESSVKVMQIVDAAHLAGCGIEKFGWNRFAQRVSLLAVLLITRYKIETIFLYHFVETWYLVR